MTEAVLYEERGPVAIATINRPEVRNALDGAALEGLWSALRAAGSPSVRALIITGAGDEAFCAGQDLNDLAARDGRLPDYPVLGKNIDLDKPVIAAVNGLAYGGGLMLSQTCDLCLAAEHACFAASEARWGRGLGWAAPLTRMIPPRVVMEMLVTAKPISAQRAFEVGFVNQVVPGPQLLDAALDMAETIAANAPLSVAASKAMVHESLLDPDLQTAADDLFASVYASEDAKEGPRAFLEKRAPVWTGR